MNGVYLRNSTTKYGMPSTSVKLDKLVVDGVSTDK